MKMQMNLVIASLLGSTLLAQEPPDRTPDKNPSQPQTRAGQDPGQHRTAGKEDDQVLITWLLVDNQNEVALARIALSRATDPEVKQFAQTMIDDHQKMVEDLRAARSGAMARAPGGMAGADTGKTKPRPDGAQPREGVADAGKDGPQTEPASGNRRVGGFDHAQLIRDLGNKCRESATEMLQQKNGADFDRCYMGLQVGLHTRAVDTLQVFQDYASPDLRTKLQQSLQTVQQHEKSAKSLADRLMSQHKTADSGR